MSEIVGVVYADCGVDPEKVAEATCEQMAKVQACAAERILKILPKIGGPVKIGDEVYQHRQDVESLLSIMEMAQKICAMKNRYQPFSGFSLPGATCPGAPRFYGVDDLRNQYQRACCG